MSSSPSVSASSSRPGHATSLEPYLAAEARWPATGRHVLATFDADTVVVYQAFGPDIADEAVRLGRFGPSFGLGRMSWIKPGFLWMMFRSGWASKDKQERVLAITIRRDFFERALGAAVASSFDRRRFATRADWAAAVHRSDVRLQWDPDHDPAGRALERRAIQIGLRGRMLAEYAGPALIRVEDVTPFVHSARAHAHAPFDALRVPVARVFHPHDPSVRDAIGLRSSVASEGADGVAIADGDAPLDPT
ncbi:MAG: DUF4291 domain-containing protein [Polyangiaceae bacterium]